MNTTKKHLTLILLGMIIILPIFTTSCFKKGSEDPFLSMYTRKARVTGEWQIQALTWDIKSDDEVNELLTVTNITDNTTWDRTIRIVGTDSVKELKGRVLEGRNEIIFYNDGRFTQTLEYEYDEVTNDITNEDIIITTTTKVQESMKGTWNFLNNIDDYKNKERLALVIQNTQSKTFVYELIESDEDEETPVPILASTYASSQAYANGEYSTIWTLRMLKNKQIIMDQDVESFKVVTVNSLGNSYTEVGYKTQTLV
ncbi:MAG: hypothetical protein PHP52_14270, partial [Bacteroidales bacterium]|nr:hypothetical protein [Bacteroidales bacterium]